MAGVVVVEWYATILRQDAFAAEVAKATPLSLRYGATQYAVHVSNDDRYKIRQMIWFEDKRGWYDFWEGPEMIEFRRRNAGRYQVLINYSWYEEIAAGALGPEVPLEAAPAPEPEPAPQAAS
jgi:hypothetical protein